MEIQPLDTASEPVNHLDDAEFMDTGVLHEHKKDSIEESETDNPQEN